MMIPGTSLAEENRLRMWWGSVSQTEIRELLYEVSS